MSETDNVEILLVEDSPDDVEMTIRALRKANLVNPVHVARDGAEALAYLFGDKAEAGPSRRKTPKLILLDLKLPKVDGFELLQRIKGDPATKLVPVVVLTSSMHQRDVVESYQLGVNSYIVKPVNFQQFVTAVGEVGMYWLLLNRPPA